MKRVLLCAEMDMLVHAEQLGLEGEHLDAIPWLLTASHAREARLTIRENADIHEVWLASCEDMDVLNLAAALRRENDDVLMLLIDNDPTGSFQSKARTAGADGVIAQAELVRRFGLEKVRSLDPAASEHVDPAAQSPLVGQAVLSESPSGPQAQASSSNKAAACREEVAMPTSSEHASGRHSAFVLSVLSGSGGAGKSTFAAVASHLCASIGLRTLLIDCDLQFGDVETLLDTKAVIGFEELSSSPQDVVQLLEKAQGKVALVKSPRESERAEEFAEKIPTILDTASRYFDIIIANTGSLWNEAQAALIERSARSVFLVDQSMSSMRACKRALDLCMRCGIPTGSFLYVLNRCSKEAPITAIDLSCALRGAHVVEIADGGRAVEESLAASMMDTLVRERNDCTVSIAALLVQILPYGGEEIAKAAGASLKARPHKGVSFIRRRKTARSRGHEVMDGAREQEGFSVPGNVGGRRRSARLSRTDCVEQEAPAPVVRAFGRSGQGYTRESVHGVSGVRAEVHS